MIHSFWLDSNRNTGSIGNPDIAFPWWSFSKTLIAICTLKLVETGALKLDACLPGRPYSIRQLLQHRAGVPDYGSLATYHEAVASDQNAWSREQLFEQVDPEHLLFQPGTGWAYSNIGYLLVREQLEQQSGLGLAALVDQFISMPLGLTGVHLAVNRGEIAERYDPGWVYHGCFVGPINAAVRMLAALRSGQLLDPESLAAMLDTYRLGGGLPGRPWVSHGYGLGLMAGNTHDCGFACGHSGAGPQSVSAVYSFEGVDNPVTVGAFTSASDEAVAENEAQRIALLCQHQ